MGLTRLSWWDLREFKTLVESLSPRKLFLVSQYVGLLNWGTHTHTKKGTKGIKKGFVPTPPRIVGGYLEDPFKKGSEAASGVSGKERGLSSNVRPGCVSGECQNPTPLG